MRNALSVPVLAQLASTATLDFVGPDGVHHHLLNHNKLLGVRAYPGATGFKTGAEKDGGAYAHLPDGKWKKALSTPGGTPASGRPTTLTT